MRRPSPGRGRLDGVRASARPSYRRKSGYVNPQQPYQQETHEAHEQSQRGHSPPGVHPMTLRRTMLRINIMVGATVAVVVFVLSVTGVVLSYELQLGAGAQGGGHRASHVGLGTKPLAAYGSSDTASTLILHCGQLPCPSREQMLSMVAAHLDVPSRGADIFFDTIGVAPSVPARVARRVTCSGSKWTPVVSRRARPTVPTGSSRSRPSRCGRAASPASRRAPPTR